MKGWKLVVALLAGAAVSQAVAYWCRARVTGVSLGSTPLPARELRLPAFLRDAWPEPDEGSRAVGLSAGYSGTTLRCPLPAPPDFRDNPPKYGLYTESFGWPCRSLVVYRPCVFTSNGNGGQIDMPRFFKEFEARAGLGAGMAGPAWMPWKSLRGSLVPVSPRWGGLAVNAGVYGMPLLAVMWMPAVLRRRRRARLGLCSACGYELAGLAACPECGTKARNKKGREGPAREC